MSIRRFTIEIDDSHDFGGRTNLPTSPDKGIDEPQKGIGGTSLPAEQSDYQKPMENEVDFDINRSIRTVGRTPSDLFVTYINSPRFMSTVLTLLSFLLLASKIDSLTSFKYPIVTAVILNILWFGWPLVGRLSKRIFKIHSS